MSESSGGGASVRGLLLRGIGLFLVVFGAWGAVRMASDLTQVLNASRQELPDRGMLTTLGIATLTARLALAVLGWQLVARGQEFAWRDVGQFFTKTALRQLLTAIACIAGGFLLGAGLAAQDTGAARTGYAIALWLLCTVAIIMFCKSWRQGRPARSGSANPAPQRATDIPSTDTQETSMLIGENQSQFHGLVVHEFHSDTTTLPEYPVAWRLSVPSYDSDQQWPTLFEQFLNTVDASTVTALIVGSWADSYDRSSAEIVEALVGAADQLTGLRAVFIGDMTFEECEISWIMQSDLTALLTTFTQLEELVIRGGNNLTLSSVQHPALQRLVIESGGLPASVVRAVAGSDLPALTDLELWLGTKDYGADSTLEDVAPILRGERLPKLTRLALCNSDYEDQIAGAVATAPVVPQLKELNLSMGVLTDTGALALLTGQSLRHLRTLNVSHNYLSEKVREQLHAALAGVQLDLGAGDAEAYEHNGITYRTVAVGE
ncbi:Uncharacterised protein [Mycobacteroides abscessus subsp. abscessus]|uniref:STM4015 family protein n=1 Tax=Mycobacteroides abscessus TaxID=36809 RepID=UPI00092C90F9|nr:STM4015 family protein [Mycobacteroides abscessus]SIH35058.1 Uncharacterised protein [Mycobacteroides abscessus subsp. abscessus]